MYKVLIVDDEPLILSGLQSLIDWEELMLKVEGAALSAEEALEFLAENDIDILITDIRMKGMSGIELIAEIRKSNHDMKLIIISGYEDFEYLKSAFQYGLENYILKPIDEEELQSTLSAAVEKLEQEQTHRYREKVQESVMLDNILHTWILSDKEDSALNERLMLYGIHLSHRFYRVAVLVPHLMQGNFENPAFDYRQLNDILRNRFVGISVCVTVDYIGRIFLVFGYDEKIDEDSLLQTACEGIREWSCQGIDSWKISLGKAVTHSYHLQRSLTSALWLLLAFFIAPDTGVISHDRKKLRIDKSLRNTGFTRGALSAMMSADAKELPAAAGELHSRLSALLAKPLENRTEIIEDILFSMFRCSKNILMQLQEESSLEIDFGGIFADGDSEAQADKICSLFSEYLRQFPKESSDFHPIVAKTLQIVEAEYSAGLSLKTLAARLNVSQVHLGRLFKRDTGKMFTAFLNDFRIEKAKQLLLHTTLKSSEIAASVGFSNPNYFSNTFKKTVGVYPTRYRSSHTNRESLFDLWDSREE